MTTKRSLAEARRFFRKEAWMKYGYLVRKKKGPTVREKTSDEARWAYWQGIRDAWEIYTKDSKVVKQANKALEKAMSRANKLYLSNESDWSDQKTKLFIEAIIKAHDECAEKVAQIWKAFMRDMEKKHFSEIRI